MNKVFSKLFFCIITSLFLTSGIFAIGAFGAENGVTVVTSDTELKAAINAGGSIRLGGNVTVTSMLTVPVGVDLILDLGGYTLSSKTPANIFALNNLGRLTVKDTVGGGEVNSRGIYNGYDESGMYVTDAELTVDSGIFNAKGTNGGGAIFNYGKATVNGGSFDAVGSYSINNRSGASMTVNNATVKEGIYNMGDLVICGGDFSNGRTGSQAVYNNGTLVINGGNFRNLIKNATVYNHSKKHVTINGGSFFANTSYYLLDGYFTITDGVFNGGIRSKNLTVSGGIFNNSNQSGYSLANTSVSGGRFTDEDSLNMARSALAAGYGMSENADGSFDVLDYESIVLRDAKYNLTTTASFVGNLYVKVPSSNAEYTVDAENSTGYAGIAVIGGAEYLVFNAGPSMNTVTGEIEFNVSASYGGTPINVFASFTTDSYFAAVMERYSKIAVPSHSDVENMTLVMNATRYANELYKYATDNGDYGAYADILNNKEWGKYLTAVTKESIADDAVSEVSSLLEVFESANLEITTGYGANYIFCVTDGYDVTKLS